MTHLCQIRAAVCDINEQQIVHFLCDCEKRLQLTGRQKDFKMVLYCSKDLGAVSRHVFYDKYLTADTFTNVATLGVWSEYSGAVHDAGCSNCDLVVEVYLSPR